VRRPIPSPDILDSYDAGYESTILAASSRSAAHITETIRLFAVNPGCEFEWGVLDALADALIGRGHMASGTVYPSA
jgi:hypothetical protein